MKTNVPKSFFASLLLLLFGASNVLQSIPQKKPFEDTVLNERQVFQFFRDGRIHDRRTGYYWLRCSVGQNPAQGLCQGLSTAMNWYDARQYCETLQLANRSWRLPKLKELKTLVDKGRFQPPLIDLRYFSVSTRAEYWSLDSNIEEGGLLYSYLNFQDGHEYAARAHTKLYVRCMSR